MTRTTESIKTGPSDGDAGTCTQVGGYVWSVTFASNTWRDPTEPHDLSYIPGNWLGTAAARTDTWNSGFSKAWGGNVGNVPMIECIHSGMWTTNGEFPINGCMLSELVAGTDTLGGGFKICLDTQANLNGLMSVELDVCTDKIDHNALASATESGGDGTSMEEKLEALENVGDVLVVRGPVNPKNGGYTWIVQFLRDTDGPCEQRSYFDDLCNAPGNVPKICDSSGSTTCDVSSLLGSCSKPGSCSKLTVLDSGDFAAGVRPPGSNERQIVVVKDPDYRCWENGSIVNRLEKKE